MDDLYEAEFSWPHSNASDVILTGSFDHWSRSLRLSKGASGFVDKVRVPWNEKITYKFIVDGSWVTRDDCPTENDGFGNINNVLFTPSRPAPPTPVTFQGPADSIPPVQVSSYGENSQQQASEAGEGRGIAGSGSSNAASAVVDVVAFDKQLSPVNVPGDTVREADTEPPNDHADQVFDAYEAIARALEYVPLTPNTFSDSSSVDNVVPSATDLAQVPTAMTLGYPSPRVARLFPMPILPVNDHTLNETAARLPHGGDSHPVVAAIAVPERSTHSPVYMPRAASPASHRTRNDEMLNSEPTKAENLEIRVVRENVKSARPSGVLSNNTSPLIDADPKSVETTDTTVIGAETPKDEHSSLAPEPHDITASSEVSIKRSNDDTKHSRNASSPSTIARKKRLPLFAKLKDFLSVRHKKSQK